MLNIVIDDGRGRDTDFRNNNKPSHAKSQESRNAKPGPHQDKGSSRHPSASGGGRRNMSRGSSNHTAASSNYKADFEVNEDASVQHNKKTKREGTKGNNPLASNQQETDKDFKNNLMWEGETVNSKKSRNQWKNLEVNNITNKTRERLMTKPNTENTLNENGEVDSRTTTAPIIDSSLYQNTYDSKTRGFVDGKQMFNNTSSLTDPTNETTHREDILFTNESLYAPTSAPTYASMTTASGNASNVGVYSTNSYIAATSLSNTITNTQATQQQLSNNSVYASTVSSYSTFPQQNVNSYGQDTSPLSINNTTGYSAQNLYQQPSSVSYSSNSYVYPHTSIASSSNLSSTTHKYPPYGVDIKSHLDSKSSVDTNVDYSNYMGTQYQESLLKDVKTPADPIGHFEFRNTLDIAPIIPLDSYMTNYMQPGPPPQSTTDYKMLYWNNVHMPNILHAPPPQYKYTSHIPYELPTSQAGQKPFMKMNDSTATTDNTYMRVHQIPTHRYPMDGASTNKMPLYNEPQPNLQSTLNEYQRYQNERHHFNDFGTFQTPPLTSSVQHNYQTNDTFGNTDLPTRILQPNVSVHHPYMNSTDESTAQRYATSDTRNKRAITGGAQLPHMNARSPHYPRHGGYDDKDMVKPPVPHTSGNIFINHNKFEAPPPVSVEKVRKSTVNTSITVASSTVTSVTSSHATTTSATIDSKLEAEEKLPTETNKKEENVAISERKNNKPPHQPPATANERERDRGPRYGGERQRERVDNRPQQYQNNYNNNNNNHSNMIKTIDFHQFQNNVMRNHPGHNKNFRSYNKPYGDKNKEFKVTKIMQRPVEENKDEIAKLPIPLGDNKPEEKNDSKKVEDDGKLKEKNTKSTNNGANKKANKQQNIQILSPAKKSVKEEGNRTEKEEVKENAKTKSKEEKEELKDNAKTKSKEEKEEIKENAKTKSKENKENKLDDKSKESKPSDNKDISKLNKKEDHMKENRQQHQQQQPQPHRRRFNMNYYNLRYPRFPYENNVDFQYGPMYDENVNRFNKFNGGNRYPNPRYNYDYDMDPRMYLYQGGGPYPPYGGPEPPVYNSLYNSNNYSNHKSKQKKGDSTNDQSKPNKKQAPLTTEDKKTKPAHKLQNEEEAKKSKKIKFKGTEILNESPPTTCATSSAPSTPTDNSNNPSSILKKSKSNEDCKERKKEEDLDEREPSSILVSKTS